LTTLERESKGTFPSFVFRLPVNVKKLPVAEFLKKNKGSSLQRLKLHFGEYPKMRAITKDVQKMYSFQVSSNFVTQNYCVTAFKASFPLFPGNHE